MKEEKISTVFTVNIWQLPETPAEEIKLAVSHTTEKTVRDTVREALEKLGVMYSQKFSKDLLIVVYINGKLRRWS